jgi:hypothetical protein
MFGEEPENSVKTSAVAALSSVGFVVAPVVEASARGFLCFLTGFFFDSSKCQFLEFWVLRLEVEIFSPAGTNSLRP